ncbi:unnamed protein product [Closterium sp. NIES-65]|nr:unnamed protein product [Closterium sp. NIES-65]
MDSRSSSIVAESPGDDSASPIHSLSDDLLTSILRLVLSANPTASDTSTSDISTSVCRTPYQVALVCKRWSCVAPLALTTLTVLSASSAASPAASFSPKRELLCRRLEQALRKFPSLTRLHLDNHTIDFIDDRFLRALGSACPNLTYLFLGKVRLPVRPPLVDAVSEAGLASVFRGCRRLEHVSVHCAPNIKSLPASLLDLPALRRLQLEAPSLKLFPEVSRGRLSTLRDLRLLSCNALPCLPDSLGDLAGLTHLRIEKSDNLEQLPDSLCDLQPLDVLVISSCYWLTSLLDDLGQLPCLRVLELEGCGEDIDNLLGLPDPVTSLGQLEKLVLGLSCSPSLPESVGALTRLKELQLRHCKGLTGLPVAMRAMTRLERLVVEECCELVALRLPEGEGAVATRREGGLDGGGQFLERLVVTRCTALQWAPGNVAQMQGLRELRLDGCRTVLLPPSLACLGRLERLIVVSNGCSGSGVGAGVDVGKGIGVDIDGGMDGSSSSDSRSGHGCVTTDEGAAGGCGTPSSGNTTDCASMVATTTSSGSSSNGSGGAVTVGTSAAATDNFGASATIIAAGRRGGGSSESMAAVHPVPLLPTSPSPPSSPRRPSPSHPAWLAQLRELEVSGFDSHSALPPSLASLSLLTRLCLTGSIKLASLPDLPCGAVVAGTDSSCCCGFPSSSSSSCSSSSLKTPSPTAPNGTFFLHLTNLRDLQLDSCLSLSALPSSLSSLSSLTRLHLAFCSSLSSLPPRLSSLSHLRSLNLQECISLTSLPPSLSALVRLEGLYLKGCIQLESLPGDIGYLPRLRELVVLQRMLSARRRAGEASAVMAASAEAATAASERVSDPCCCAARACRGATACAR